MVMLVVEPISKLAVVLVGVVIILIGIALMQFGHYVRDSLNVMYARLPGRFQYPNWWPRLIGGLVCAFGVLVAVVGGVFAK